MIDVNGDQVEIRYAGQAYKVQNMADGGWQLTVRCGQDTSHAAAMFLAIAMDTDNLIDFVAVPRAAFGPPDEDDSEDEPTGSRLADALDAEHGVWDDPGVYALDDE